MADIAVKFETSAFKITYKGEKSGLLDVLKELTKTAEYLQTIEPPKTKVSQPSRSATSANRKSQKTVSTKKSSDRDPADKFDHVGLANIIKQSEKFPVLKTKFLIPPRNWYSKAKFVMFFAQQPLSSGDIERTLTSFGVKTDLPAISKALSANKADLIIDTSSTYKRYSLGLAEIEKFKDELAND